ncbi:homoserine O-acetyltransferase [Zhihengliuella halotolerans]|uniref:Homoserine O-acetyltransferase n=2 Tax=Zhihengliuella halotolerans TaxID=370736 RepID=A0A4Q8ADW1_9MICC|nr:homoserine O-acetyltransferase [Zhihengliuella halotolerans]RZU61971.1 homoserine O-acetyltransferase [Zhihengliuella halotolerans]
MSSDVDTIMQAAGVPKRAGAGERPLDADGVLRVLRTGEFAFETGGTLPGVDIAYETWGTLDADAANAVLLLHALTGDTHVARGISDEPGWWDGFVGPGRTIDTDKYFVVAPGMVGGCNGTTGPGSAAPDGRAWGSRFPFTTIRDSVRLEERLADALGVDAWHTVIGGSMGGARALEWAATLPGRVRRCVPIAATAASTAEQIAFAQIQTQAIRLDPDFAGGDYYRAPAAGPGEATGFGEGPVAGLGIARRMAHITYRSDVEFDARFGREPQCDEQPLGSPSLDRGRYQVESYLDYQAAKLVGRFDANSYLVITEALMSHDVGRGRGGVEAALGALEGIEFFVAAVDSDRLYWPAQAEAMAAHVPNRPNVEYIRTPVGHDGFLTDVEQLSAALKRTIFAD